MPPARPHGAFLDPQQLFGSYRIPPCQPAGPRLNHRSSSIPPVWLLVDGWWLQVTDIQDSTALWEMLPSSVMDRAIKEHHTVGPPRYRALHRDVCLGQPVRSAPQKYSYFQPTAPFIHSPVHVDVDIESTPTSLSEISGWFRGSHFRFLPGLVYHTV